MADSGDDSRTCQRRGPSSSVDCQGAAALQAPRDLQPRSQHTLRVLAHARRIIRGRIEAQCRKSAASYQRLVARAGRQAYTGIREDSDESSDSSFDLWDPSSPDERMEQQIQEAARTIAAWGAAIACGTTLPEPAIIAIEEMFMPRGVL